MSRLTDFYTPSDYDVHPSVVEDWIDAELDEKKAFDVRFPFHTSHGVMEDQEELDALLEDLADEAKRDYAKEYGAYHIAPRPRTNDRRRFFHARQIHRSLWVDC